MQRLLSSAAWDADAVLGDVPDWVLSYLGDPDAIVVSDETGGVKKDAAELMGISQRALSYYLAKYRIDEKAG